MTTRGTEWRRRKNRDTWHFHPACRWWPTANYMIGKVRHTKPTYGELCNECQAKARAEGRLGRKAST